MGCACCKGSNSMQCGWPMHRFCYKKSKMGCPGVCNNKYTLSGKGFPCYSDKSKGITVPGVQQGVSSATLMGRLGQTPRMEVGARIKKIRNTARVSRVTVSTFQVLVQGGVSIKGGSISIRNTASASVLRGTRVTVSSATAT